MSFYHTHKESILISCASVVVIGLFAAGGYHYYKTYTTLTQTKAELTSTTERLENEAAVLEETLAISQKDNSDLAEALYNEQSKNDLFEDQIRDLSQTVGKLDKLSQIDPELLQKYSKVYFLNEHYTPSKIQKIDEEYAFEEGRDYEVLAEVRPFLEDLLEAASDDDIEILVASAYRSFGTQSGLKSHYSVLYGAGTANQFSADQGYSEHQLGTTVDFTTKEIGGTYAGFQNTEAYKWLTENAHKYGFTLSYSEGNVFYQFEPWHWRFVGKDLARDLHRDDKSFYDLDQRKIDTYLIDLFD